MLESYEAERTAQQGEPWAALSIRGLAKRFGEKIAVNGALLTLPWVKSGRGALVCGCHVLTESAFVVLGES